MMHSQTFLENRMRRLRVKPQRSAVMLGCVVLPIYVKSSLGLSSREEGTLHLSLPWLITNLVGAARVLTPQLPLSAVRINLKICVMILTEYTFPWRCWASATFVTKEMAQRCAQPVEKYVPFLNTSSLLFTTN